MKLSCRLFGHEYERARTGLTGVGGKPVFRCRKCGAEWITAKGWRHRNSPMRRDHFPSVEVNGPARDEAGLNLLRTDPDEFFRRTRRQLP